MFKKICKNLILLFAVMFLAIGCKTSRYKYSSDNLMAKLYTANEGQFAYGYAHDIFIPSKTEQRPVENISAEAYFVASVHANNKDTSFLRYKNPYNEMPIASLTKLMTMLVVLRNCENLDEVYEVPADAINLERNASVANLQAGDKVKIKDLLHALMLPSGNDAALTLAINCAGGSVDNFSIMMNNEANRIGAMHTHFVNPHGLNSNYHYSCCYDLYLIIRQLMKYPIFSEITSMRTYKTTVTDLTGNERELVWENTNYFVMGEMVISSNVSLVAGKTGYTQNAGDCLAIVSKAVNNDEHYISIVLNATSKSNVYRNTNKLLAAIGK